jgi:hypothetical protein
MAMHNAEISFLCICRKVTGCFDVSCGCATLPSVHTEQRKIDDVKQKFSEEDLIDGEQR